MQWNFEFSGCRESWHLEDYNGFIEKEKDMSGEIIYRYECKKKQPTRFFRGVRSSLSDAMRECEQILEDDSK